MVKYALGIIAVIIILFIIFSFYCCLVAGARADRQTEETLREIDSQNGK